jgi:hypothetical protein
VDVGAGDAGGVDLETWPAEEVHQPVDREGFAATRRAVQDHRRRELDAERLVAVAVQDDVDDVLVEEGRQFGTPGEFEDLVGFRLGAFDLLHLLGGAASVVSAGAAGLRAAG